MSASPSRATMRAFGTAAMAGNTENGDFIVKRTVDLSSASTRATGPTSPRYGDDVVGHELAPVMEAAALPQFERPHLGTIAGAPRLGEVRHRLAFRVETGQ